LTFLLTQINETSTGWIFLDPEIPVENPDNLLPTSCEILQKVDIVQIVKRTTVVLAPVVTPQTTDEDTALVLGLVLGIPIGTMVLIMLFGLCVMALSPTPSPPAEGATGESAESGEGKKKEEEGNRDLKEVEECE